MAALKSQFFIILQKAFWLCFENIYFKFIWKPSITIFDVTQHRPRGQIIGAINLAVYSAKCYEKSIFSQ